MVRWVVSVMVGVVVLAAARPALAGTYEVNACAGGSVNRSWVASNSNDAAFDVKPGCPFEVYSAVTAGATAGFFEAAWWRLTAPPSTVIDRLRLARYGYRFVDRADRPEGGQPQGGWTTGAYVVDNGAVKPIAGESCLVQPGAYLCDFGSKNTSAPVDLDLNATQVTYQVACVRDGGTCDTESDGFPLAGMTIFNAVATVRDDTAPKLGAGGSLLAGGWHRPDEEVSLEASDATGISSAVASAGAGTGALATPCDYSQMVPCANVKAGLRLTGLADGRQSLTVTVKDAAGNPATTTAAINVDGTPPYVEWQPRSGRTLAAKVSDAYSGVAGGQIAVDGTALPTMLANGRLTATLPAGLARGAQVTLSVSDNAGNSATGRAGAARDRPAREGPQRPRRDAARPAADARGRRDPERPGGGDGDDQPPRRDRRARRHGDHGRARALRAAPARRAEPDGAPDGQRRRRAAGTRARRRGPRPRLLDDPRVPPRRERRHAGDVLGPDPRGRPAPALARPDRRAAGSLRRSVADVRRHPHLDLRPLERELPLPRRARAATRSGCGSGARAASRSSSATRRP